MNVEERIQTVVFIRHGIALHNIMSSNRSSQDNRKSDPSLIDAPLVPEYYSMATEVGQVVWDYFSQRKVEEKNRKQQATKHDCEQTDSERTMDVDTEKMNSTNQSFQDALIVTSPLTRCIQTTILAFLSPEYSNQGGVPNFSKNLSYSCASNPSSVGGIQTKDSTICGGSDRRNVQKRIFCHESLREAYGMHYSDQRRSKSILKVYNLKNSNLN